MSPLIHYLLTTASPALINLAILMLRISVGILTIGHGFPKIMGGVPMWTQLGTFVNPLGIYFWPLMWGFLGACTEFFGGIALTVGFGTRIASLALIFMMIVATVWHIDRGDSYNAYSFPLTLVFVYLAFFIIGGGSFSFDSYMSRP